MGNACLDREKEEGRRVPPPDSQEQSALATFRDFIAREENEDLWQGWVTTTTRTVYDRPYYEPPVIHAYFKADFMEKARAKVPSQLEGYDVLVEEWTGKQ
jgi:hypothetical protein